MVQVIENWAEVSGTVATILFSDRGDDWLVIEVDPAEVTDVEGYPNLVAQAPRPLQIRCRRVEAAMAEIGVGRHVTLRARLGGPGDVLAGPITMH